MDTDPQQGKPTPAGTVAVSQTEYGTFKNYAFAVDGKAIEQQALVDHQGAMLDKTPPYDNKGVLVMAVSTYWAAVSSYYIGAT